MWVFTPEGMNRNVFCFALLWWFIYFLISEQEKGDRLTAPGKNNAFLNQTIYVTEEGIVETSLKKVESTMQGTLSWNYREIYSYAFHVPDLSI